jgi:hypothetical protein
MSLRQLVALCLGAVVVIALVGIQFWFREPSVLEQAERELDLGAAQAPKVFEPPEYRLPPDAVARSLRASGLPVEDRAIFPDAFNNAGSLVAGMLRLIPRQRTEQAAALVDRHGMPKYANARIALCVG